MVVDELYWKKLKLSSHNPTFSQYYTAIIFLTSLLCVKLYSDSTFTLCIHNFTQTCGLEKERGVGKKN
jgi:hypothetical protein